jgi:hypothetical protein
LDSDGKIKALLSLGAFCWSDQWVIALSAEGPAGSLREFANDINAIAPSIVAFGRLVIGESWTAREKRRHPPRVDD